MRRFGLHSTAALCAALLLAGCGTQEKKDVQAKASTPAVAQDEKDTKIKRKKKARNDDKRDVKIRHVSEVTELYEAASTTTLSQAKGTTTAGDTQLLSELMQHSTRPAKSKDAQSTQPAAAPDPMSQPPTAAIRKELADVALIPTHRLPPEKAESVKAAANLMELIYQKERPLNDNELGALEEKIEKLNQLMEAATKTENQADYNQLMKEANEIMDFIEKGSWKNQ